MRNPHGHIVWSGEGSGLELDTVTCIHCNTVVFVKMDMSNVGFCRKCMDHVCGPCADSGKCLPFEKQLEDFEKGITKKLLTDRAVDDYLRRG